MSGRNYTMTDEDREAMEALLAEEAPPRANVTLDPIEIRGRPDVEGDDALDVAESIERKGPPTGPSPMTYDPDRAGTALAASDRVDRSAELRGMRESPLSEFATGVARRARAEGEAGRAALHAAMPAIDEATGFSRGMNALERAVPALEPWLESGTAGASGVVRSLPFEDAAIAGAESLAAGMSGEDDVAAYTRAHDEVNAALDADEAASPSAFRFGEGVGGVAQSLAVPPLVNPTSFGTAALGGSLEGALFGGMEAADRSEDWETLPEDVMEGAGYGAAFGGVAAPVVHGLGRVADWTGDAIRRHGEAADRLRTIAPAAAAGSDVRMTEAMRDLPGPRRPDGRTGPLRPPEAPPAEPGSPEAYAAIANRMREMGLGGVRTADELVEAAGSAHAGPAARLAEIRTGLNAGGPVPVPTLTRVLDEYAETLRAPGSPLGPNGPAYADAISDYLRRTEEMYGINGEVPYSQAMDIMDGLVSPNVWRTRVGAELAPEAEVVRRGRGMMRDALDEWASGRIPERAGATTPRSAADLLDEYREMRAREMTARTAGDAATAARDRLDRNRGLSPTDYLAIFGGLGSTAAGAYTGSPEGMGAGLAGAALFGLGNRALRRHESTLRASTAETVRDLLRHAPERLGDFAAPLAAALRRGASAYMATLGVLENDPEFVETVNSIAPADEAPIPATLEEFMAEGSPADRPIPSTLEEFMAEEN